MTLDNIKALPVGPAADDISHLYLWVPNALLPEGLAVMAAWGFRYKSNIVWRRCARTAAPTGAASASIFAT